MNSIFDSILSAIIYLIATFALFFIGKMVYSLFHPKVNVKEELVFKDNFAFATAHVGYFIGLLLAIGSALSGPSDGIVSDLIDLTIYGLLGIVLLNFSVFINAKIILRKFNVAKEILTDQNTGTGVIEGANAIATGLIIFGAVSGDGGNVFTTVGFWIIGQTLIIVSTIVYAALLPYDVHEQIEKDNVAAGIGFAGAIIAIANLIRYALMPDFESWTISFTTIGIDFLIGMAFLPIARLAADKILLPGQKLTNEIVNQEKPNHGAALIEAFAYIGGSVLITWAI
ncbi:MAG TPA: DUF350 domain-containing protein [Bacteroidales bacterium]|nr:DUF350 domain-containing protein [Bacteroidales bacterium]